MCTARALWYDPHAPMPTQNMTYRSEGSSCRCRDRASGRSPRQRKANIFVEQLTCMAHLSGNAVTEFFEYRPLSLLITSTALHPPREAPDNHPNDSPDTRRRTAIGTSTAKKRDTNRTRSNLRRGKTKSKGTINNAKNTLATALICLPYLSISFTAI